MPKVRMRVTFDQRKIAKIAGSMNQLATHVMPRLLDSVAPVIEAKFKEHLPDSDITHTREKQSAKSRARWPFKLNKQVKKKRISDDTGTLLIVGVKIPEGNYVKIDFHKKATSTGRLHVLWGKRVKGLRVEKRDIPKVVLFETKTLVEETVTKGIRDAVKNGEVV